MILRFWFHGRAGRLLRCPRKAGDLSRLRLKGDVFVGHGPSPQGRPADGLGRQRVRFNGKGDSIHSRRQFGLAVLAVAALALLLGGAGETKAAFIITFKQVDTNTVEADGLGSINTSALTFEGSGAHPVSLVNPGLGQVTVGPTTSPSADLYKGFTGPLSFGSGGGAASRGSGDIVAIVGGGGSVTPTLAVPAGYVSGTPLSDSATWDNTTISNLGLTPGTYTPGHGARGPRRIPSK
jgi:hypothetical protein